MMNKAVLIACMAVVLSASALAAPETTNISPNVVPARVFELSSPTIMTNGPIPQANIANAMGCEGANKSPGLNWQGEPQGTLSYAVTIYDQDAPGGFWHWIVYDVPVSKLSLQQGASQTTMLPVPAKESFNSSGAKGYIGPCPPLGGKNHRYLMTVYALNTTLLNVNEDAPATDVLAAIDGATLAKASIVGFHARPK